MKMAQVGSMIYQLEEVMFHSFILNHQRVPPIRGTLMNRSNHRPTIQAISGDCS